MNNHSRQPINDNYTHNHKDHASKKSYVSLSDLPSSYLNWIEENGFDVICVCDKQGKFQYLSSSVKRLLGFDSSDLISENALDYFSPQDQEKLKQTFWSNPTIPTTIDLQVKQKSGKYIWVETIVSLQEGDAGEEEILALMKDISDKKEAEEMMIRSEKMSVAGQLAAGIAHEIRNPLTSLKGFLQLLQVGSEDEDGYYTIMNEEIEKIETITSELLFISKPMTNERKSEPLLSMIKDVCTLLQSQAKLHHIDLVLQCEEEFMVSCDRSQIKQVFINLIKNAVEVMENGGKITISTYTKEQFVFIDIIDEGPGVPKHLINKIKEPFFTTKKNGTGLGLMITHQILEKHNGKLEVHDHNPNGSIFRVLLPVEKV
ncbi:PAS domain S-box protein [Pontibacillus yanchengensis]|uniref:PAS domain S-box protein n=2 Tax=Pontibacillus yanchengensis TaxID=462910 RepID=A0ACC7VBI3_9BACI|nr:ATP-binding protein [Pontibacillus yanchengensis]MYL33264.1 PAS domain S-box protein [Pontibacillus yanchengensis]MYL51900.1 PAS domain S-box protein [Pontibacillus yanchengensis]